MTDLVLDRLAVTFAGKTRLHPLGATIEPGRIVAVVGPNGAGKSTLLRAIAALVAAEGQARFGGTALAALPARERARIIAYLPQAHVAAWSMPVRDMVALGAYAFGTPHPPAALAGVVDDMLRTSGIADLADRPIDRLSGGEQALAALARVLVAQCPVLLLDEPVAALDIGRQYAVMEQIAGLAAGGRTVLVILHDLALVAQFAHQILWLDAGRLVAFTDNGKDAVDAHAAALLGRGPKWTIGDAAAPPSLFFAR